MVALGVIVHSYKLLGFILQGSKGEPGDPGGTFKMKEGNCTCKFQRSL